MRVLQRRTWVAAMVAGLAVPVGWAAPSTVLVQHAQGATAVPQRPQRVVVYDLATLDTMQALGMAVRGVPQAQLPPYLAGYVNARYTVAGSLFEPDYAALSQIRPDLIIVGGRSAAKYEALGKIAPTLDFSVRGDHLLQDMARNITQLAQLSGQPAQGQALLARLEREVGVVRHLAAQAEPGLLLMAVNERILPNAPGSRFGFLFDVLGARSALRAQDLPAHGTVYDFDAVARLDPAWIYVIDRNAATGSAPGGGVLIPSQQVFDNAQVRGTQAGRKGQVVFLDPKGWYLLGSAGPTALLGNLAQLQQVYRAAGLR
ncbi:ABC transporter substrate-binding protein [Comamonas aquatica]|uniref:siderophore ABC transporter substrate-binding protein n=1 Tax=Comamonas aquatica TaxID=225991 RepID=UPI0022DE3AED|nr:ABC transporter substrate-binding protein [Comamonas aquatica]MDH1901155.1 ABC transporter substrate-binding protein [Comamonas aquatica]WBM41836.1 ABC transporter substrate-binding protein [Comamonas aquatica]